MKYLEENFLSVVLVVYNDQEVVVEKVLKLHEILKKTFRNYEIIVVDNMSTDRTIESLMTLENITIIELFRKHNGQQALTAGIDSAVGDYIVEIEDCRIDIDENMIIDMYRESQKGNDFVFCTPEKTSIASRFFYWIINKHFKQSTQFDLTSSIMTLSSRRGQNKSSATGNRIVNRNITYILSGLNYSTLQADTVYFNRRGWVTNINFMMDTLIFYTDLLISFAVLVSALCMLVAASTGIYSVITYYSMTTAPGWASQVVMGSAAFSAVFFMLSVISKYLYHILRNTSKSKDYIFKNIIKRM